LSLSFKAPGLFAPGLFNPCCDYKVISWFQAFAFKFKSAPLRNVFTLMGKEIDSKGNIIDPIRCDWTPGGVFVTPPGGAVQVACS
jgi:hypothetical protein